MQNTLLSLAILIPICPLLAFLLIVVLGRKLPGKGAGVAILMMAVAWILMLLVDGAWVMRVVASQGHPAVWEAKYTWLQLGPIMDIQDVSLAGGYMVDSATAVLLFVVTTVGTLIFWYASSYMEGDAWYPRFFAYLSLFSAAMLGVVISNSLLWFFMCWEIMGLCSYFLIGFWYDKPSAMRAAKKAFVVTRVGDVGFFIGILTLYYSTMSHSLTFSDIFTPIELTHLNHMTWTFAGASASASTVIALLIFCGSIGKSGQFPLHVWLPDAMEGPTPVSAMIHAATMVAAGVFLVARMYPVFVGPAATERGATSVPLMVVAGVGAFTAVFAATMGMPSMDIKKVLAYSTISQLGYMYIGLGCFGYTAALFHLMTHAFFKALLFLGAGSVHHATHTYDMREMGGLRGKMPITSFTFWMGCFALAGMIPFSGFWSKDAILTMSFLAHGWYYKLIFLMGLFGALLTAFYTFRMYFMVFEGKARDHHIYDHAHESPRAMTFPLQILAVGAVFIGFVGIPFAGLNLFGKLAEYSYKLREGLSAEETAGLTIILMIVSLAVVTLGIWLAYNTYFQRRFRTPEEGGLRGAGLQPAYVAASRLWYMNEFYTDLLVQPLMTISAMIGELDDMIIDGILVNGPAWLAVKFGRVNDWVDRNIVDGLVRVVAGFNGELGLMFRNVQQGVVQVYALIVFVSVFCLVIVMHFLR